MRRRTSLLPVLLLALVSGAARGGTPVESLPAQGPSALSSVADFERLLKRIDDEQRAVETELAGIDPRIETLRKRMLARGRAYYRHVHAGLLPVGEGFDALVDHAARVERVRRALERDIADEKALLERRTELEGRILRLRGERAPLELQREAMMRAKRALEAEDERRAAFARAFESSTRPDYVAIYGADSGPRDADARLGFEAQKGRLLFPVAGRAEVRRSSKHGVSGIELFTQPGAAVRSVAAGRVVFADRYDGYALTVIIDHGDRYYSVYASLGGTELRAGDPVAAGARVGTAPAAGQGDTVYFEIRRGATPLDPGPWLGL
ncbi:peptidoglycan DD-metalloendopeptidase family protein [Polyangium sp. y55x31]|uniref:murein hydrolase activator EnvC family protein n=1 Tax=Polyangium sp. y55x31 TaxID=3042688 RepID=UPI002482C872|nr:peptidoglycan DD-metalloendopeptidase family protein [Polyangium sp. y55x31]MDI1482591.1 peptidoglycan DD-metalloendopeptidase family protein [Polyangium sp. y55x31]